MASNIEIKIGETPVAKKTRNSVRLKHKMEDKSEFLIDEVSAAAPATPTTTKRNQSETPRRSARKSVRPPLDYEEIIERNTLSSASREKKERKSMLQALLPEEAVKWTAAEVGRHSIKRHRSGSRKSSKRAKFQNEIEEEAAGAEDKQQSEEGGGVEKEELQLEAARVTEEEQPLEVAAEPRDSDNDDPTTKPKLNDEIDEKNKSNLNLNTQMEVVAEDAKVKLDAVEASTNAILEVAAESEDINPVLEAAKSGVEPKAVKANTLVVKVAKLNLKLEVQNPLLEETKSDLELEVIEDVSISIVEANVKLDAVEAPTILEEAESKLAAALETELEDTRPILEGTKSNVEQEAVEEVSGHKNPIVQTTKSNVELKPFEDSNKEAVKLNVELAAAENAFGHIKPNEDSAKPNLVTRPNSILKTAKLNSDDMYELGLCPMAPDEQFKDDDNADHDHDLDMLPLVILSDDEENILNGTFDADQMVNVGDIADQADDKKSEGKPKGYRFPTPIKHKRKPSFKFNKLPTIDGGSTVEEPCPLTPQNEQCRPRKRSKSVSGLRNDDKAKSVSFFSPIEVAHVEDIDKRWDPPAATSNITQRRKRSKSLDEKLHEISRIPRPKQYPPAAAAAAVVKVATPCGKLKTRTKLPDFAAIHQKHFGQMENLVDHVERKALRAKMLTSSALKQQQEQHLQPQQQTTSSTTKKLPNKIEERSRPQALKKIDLPSLYLSGEMERQKRLPTPRKIVATKTKTNAQTTTTATATTTSKKAIATRAVFNFSTSAPKRLNSTSTSSKPAAEPLQNCNKTEARRQRHIEMFKGGRGATKEKRSELIRGVRSNRRFELQMQHRRQMDG